MRLRRPLTLAAAALAAALALAACDATRPVASKSATTTCTRCHGGEQDQSGAPPRDVSGRSDTSLPSVGAHRAHVAAGLDCDACHVKPTSGGDHVDGRAPVVFGRVATRDGAVSPTYDAGATYGCATLHCHGSFTGGNGSNVPVWTATGQGQGACGTCHGDPTTGAALPRSNHAPVAGGAGNASCAECHADTVDATGAIVPSGRHVNGIVDVKHPAGWATPGSAAFHGDVARKDPLGCDGCHARVQPASGTSTVTCADCHRGGQAWTTTCNGCHGEAGDPRGAPPAAIDGTMAATSLGVGAHRRHVDGSAVSGPLGCVFCHEAIDDAYDAKHLDGAVRVTGYRGGDAAWIAAGRDPGWSRSSATCATSYCHGEYALPETAAPVWTAPREDACGTCHGIPPGGEHPVVGSDLRGCAVCHPDSVTGEGSVKPGPGGAHLDGRVSVMAEHVAGWMDEGSPEFHAYSADRSLSSCRSCHGADLSGGVVQVACTSCHDGTKAGAWSCVLCHGGDASAAPPKAIWGYAGDPLRGGGVADPVRVGGHAAHVRGGGLAKPIACETCHVSPATALSPGHLDPVAGTGAPTAEVAFTGIATRGGAGSAWDRTVPTCSVYCHGAKFATASAGTNTAPRWTGGPTEAACGTCHGKPPGGTHPTSTQCGSCHAGYTSTTVNLELHIDGTVQPPTLDCASCHGDRTRAATAKNPRLAAAPPWGTYGDEATTSRGVGAHQLHLVGGALSEGVACEECHVVPTTFGAGTGHPSAPGSVAELTWGPLAGSASQWDPDDFTCSATYCHGNFTLGNASNAPTWTAPRTSACGTCHGDPAVAASALPRAGHVALAAGSTNAACSACHPQTVGADGTIAPGGKHVDGQPQTSAAASHPAGWASPTSPGLHGDVAAANAFACDTCHARSGAARVTTVTCADCHAGGQAWTTTCNGCHGEAGDPRGAPPADVHGNEDVSFVGVGAHRKHVDGSSVSAPLDCVFCHEKPADAYAAGHLDGAVTVTGYRGADADWIAAGTDPGWSPGTRSCATSYCHSRYAPANVPIWTATGEGACGTCHGLPPEGEHPAVGTDLRGCSACHPDSITAEGVVKPGPAGAHLDGVVSVMAQHVAGWMDAGSPEFHALAANRGLSSCQGCHGQDLGGGFVRVSCASCHDGTRASPFGCVMCHGGAASTSGAPPRAIWGQAGDPQRGGGVADPVRVGAHTVHLAGSALAKPIACETCHVKPASIFAAGHVDEIAAPGVPTASVAFGGVAAGATWSRATPTCAVYCHGAGFEATTAGTNTAPSWTGGPTQATCGSCHGTPPLGTHPSSTACGSCHLGYTATTVNLDTHVNGVVEPPKLDCASCHGDRSRAPDPNDPDLLSAAPPYGTHGETGETTRAVGAHQRHLVEGALSAGFACTECHDVPTAFGTGSGHPSGDVELKTTIGGGGTWSPGTLSCSATYCHGSFTYGDAANEPVWNRPAAEVCGTCHGLPPSNGHPSNADCGRCHPGYTGTTVNIETHVNGRPDAELNCTSCHGDASRTSIACPATAPGCVDPLQNVAPPASATGASAGAHLVHVNLAAKSLPARCVDCHSGKVPTPSTSHPSAVIDVAFGGRAVLGGAAASYDRTTGCSATYCHGNYTGTYTYTNWTYDCPEPDGCPVEIRWNYAGKKASPAWTDAPTTCASCHGNPPADGSTWHSGQHGTKPEHNDCSLCHPDAAGTASTGTRITDVSKHVNGTVEVAPRRTSVCMGCH